MLDLIGYAVLLAAGLALRALPIGAALAIGRAGGRLAFAVLRIRRRVVLANLRHVFEGKSETELRRLARDSYRQFGMAVVELLRASATPAGRLEDVVRIEGIEDLIARQKSGKGLIVCVPHYGSIDLLGYAAAGAGLRLHVIMRPLKGRRLNRLLVETRERHGVRLLVKGAEGMREALDVLRAGGAVGILPDQNAGRRGVVVDFLGKPASTYASPAVAHLETGAAIAVVVDERLDADSSRHRARVIFLEESRGDAREIMQRVSDVMGEAIRKRPEQYFWMHRRWGPLVG